MNTSEMPVVSLWKQSLVYGSVALMGSLLTVLVLGTVASWMGGLASPPATPTSPASAAPKIAPAPEKTFTPGLTPRRDRS